MTSILLAEARKTETSRARRVLSETFPKAYLVSAGTSEQVQELVTHRGWDLVVTEPELEKGNALDVIELIRGLDPRPPLILLSETGADRISLQALNRGIRDLVVDTDEGISRLAELSIRILEERRHLLTRGRRERDLGHFFTLALEMLCVLDAEGAFHKTNPAFGLTMGYRAEEILGKSLFDLVHPDDSEECRKDWHHMLEEHTSSRFTYRFRRGEGSFAILEWSFAAIPGMDQVFGAARDVSSRVALERELRYNAGRLRTVVDALPDALLLTNDTGIVENINPAAEKLFGHTQTEVFGVRLNALFREAGLDDLQSFLRVIPKKGREVEVTARGKGGVLFDVNLFLTRLELGITDLYLCMVRPREDQTFTPDMDASLHQQYTVHQRETLSAMASSIAHDFSNLLSPMIGYTEIALSDLPPGSPAQDSLNHVLEATHKARGLIENIYAKSKRKMALVPVDLQQVVRDTIRLIENLAPGQIRVSRHIGSFVGDCVMGDAHIISLMMLNLARNSFEGLGTHKGRLDITLERFELPVRDITRFNHLKEGSYALLRFFDTGPGITEKDLPYVFMPFFTRKGEHHLGLGLTVADKTSRKLGGEVLVSCPPGGGTEVEIYLPLIEKKQESDKSGKLRVLLVDDEKDITNMLREILERHHCQVTVCNSGSAALVLFKQDVDQFDLVVTDQRMPDMKGTRLAETIHVARPEIPIILISGYGGEELDHNLDQLGIRRYLMKPVSTKVLLETIHEVTGWEEP